MPNNKHRLSGVYAIADTGIIPHEKLIDAVEQAIEGGAALIQYRDKSEDSTLRHAQANQLQALCKKHQVPLIINDDLDLAKDCGASGIHLGRHDIDLETARETLGADAIIGISCYNEPSRAKSAEAGGADYVAFGSVFPSSTKPNAVSVSIETLAQMKQTLSIPVCAIGGITDENAAPLLETGVDLLAVINGIFGQQDIRAATRQLAKLSFD